MSTSPLARELEPALSHHLSDASDACSAQERQIIESMASRGMLDSSHTVLHLIDSSKVIFDQHVKRLYDDLLQLSIAHLGDTSLSRQKEIEDLFQSMAELMSARLLGHAQSSVLPNFSNFSNFRPQAEEGYTRHTASVIARHMARLRVEFPAKARIRTPAAQPIFNGPVMNAVIGNNNNVQGTQINGLTVDQVRQLFTSLSELRFAVGNDAELSNEERAARIRSLDILKSEVEQPNPSRYTVGGLLNGVSTWTQGMAATPGAVNAINELMSLFR